MLIQTRSFASLATFRALAREACNFFVATHSILFVMVLVLSLSTNSLAAQKPRSGTAPTFRRGYTRRSVRLFTIKTPIGPYTAARPAPQAPAPASCR